MHPHSAGYTPPFPMRLPSPWLPLSRVQVSYGIVLPHPLSVYVDTHSYHTPPAPVYLPPTLPLSTSFLKTAGVLWHRAATPALGVRRHIQDRQAAR
jgi:hypothetical protein